MLAADNVEHVDQPGESSSGILTVARRRADRVYNFRFSVGFRAHGFGHFDKSFQFQRRLGNNQRRMQRRQLFDFARLADNERVVRRIADDAYHLRVIGITGYYDVAPLLRRALRQTLDAGHKRAGSIDDLGGAGFELKLHQPRDAMPPNPPDL